MARCRAFFGSKRLGVTVCLLLVFVMFVSFSLWASAAVRVRDVPRNRTLVMSLFGPGASELTEDAGLGNANPYSLGGLGRVRTILNKTTYEFLYLYNHNTGEEIPWLAESYRYNSDYSEITFTLRRGITWSDGKPFTTRDFAFTLNMLKQYPTLVFSSDIKEWVKEVRIVDDRTARIVLTKPNPRFFFFYFVENSEIHIPILPEHIWKDKDPEKFSNQDIDQGWPVGTGPYRLVSSTSSAQMYDRRDDWWAAKTGFKKLPEPLRIIVVPPGAAESAAQRLIDSEFDIGPVLGKGTFEAAKARNPKLISWNRQGPQWGAADACLLSVGMNTKVEPFNDREIRRAVAYAIDRQKTIDLAYEGAVILQVIPFSSYGGLNPYRDAVKDIVAKYNPGEYNPSKTAEIMTRKGYRKGSDGFWVGPDGKKLTLNLDVPSWLNPLGPVVERQLQDAGFDVQFKLYAPDATPFFQSVRNGDSKLWIIVHCGSGREPWGTLQHFHSKWSAPIGQSTRYIWANSRYENPEYDRLIDQMDTIPPSPKDQKYMDLTRRAIEIYLRDLPQIYISDEMHVVTFNEYYWTGWAGGNDPYVAPYSLWAGFLLEILNLKPAR